MSKLIISLHEIINGVTFAAPNINIKTTQNEKINPIYIFNPPFSRGQIVLIIYQHNYNGI